MKNDPIVFIGGPLDRKYLPVHINDSNFSYRYEEGNELRELTYIKVDFPWKNGEIVSVMLQEGLPESYRNLITQSFKQGVDEDLTLASIILCLPDMDELQTA